MISLTDRVLAAAAAGCYHRVYMGPQRGEPVNHLGDPGLKLDTMLQVGLLGVGIEQVAVPPLQQQVCLILG